MTLFSAAELAVYLQRAVSEPVYDLAHELTEDVIRGEVGAKLTDPPQPGVKSVAMALAGRLLTNPGGLRSATAGAVAETYSDDLSSRALSEDERARLRKACGLGGRAGMLNVAPDTETACIVTRSVW
jgi:hypothetical protein